MHSYGKFPEKLVPELGVEATQNALKDANVEWRDIQFIGAGCGSWDGIYGVLPGQWLSYHMGETGIPTVNVSNACATPQSAFRLAYMEVASGACDIALAVGMDMTPKGFLSTAGQKAEVIKDDYDYLRFKLVGLPNPGYWALDLRRRMAEYGTTEETLARIKVIASRGGALNPHARFRKIYTIEEVLNSSYVAYPLRLLEICAVSDGAAAVVLCSMDVARKHTTKPITVAASTMASSIYGDPSIRIMQFSTRAEAEAPMLSESVVACKTAYAQAGIGPEDIDVLEIPDLSSWHVLVYLEADGFCKPGEADRLVDEEAIAIGGKLPVNPSGGESSFGECVAAAGIAQACEITWQLRGEAGPRQVEGCKVGLCQTYGAQGNNGAIILKK